MFTDDDLIHSYTRKQAIEDGVLVDLTEQAKVYGFKVPFAVTDALWGQIEWTDADTKRKPGLAQTTAGRLHDVLTMAFVSARQASHLGVASVNVPVLMVEKHGTCEDPRQQSFYMIIGPGDDGEPVCTLMLEGED